MNIETAIETWPMAGEFVISRGVRTVAESVVVRVEDYGHVGRGECLPVAHYGESTSGVVSAIGNVNLDRPDRDLLAGLMPAGAARNALDCALWDLEAKKTGIPVAERCGAAPLRAVVTAYTISLGTPVAMAEAARQAADRPLLKIKLGGPDDGECLAAVRAAAPDAVLIVDANEGWRPGDLRHHLKACADNGVALIEQPLPAGSDELLAQIDRLVPICADESLHTLAELDALASRYDAINIKLDKTGGLTHALELKAEARNRGLAIMIGCMVAGSLAMAPALMLAGDAEYVDLDGPLLLARDRTPGLVYRGSFIDPPSPALWG